MGDDTRKWGWMELGSEEAFGPFESREDTLADAAQMLRIPDDPPRITTIRVGRCTPVVPSDHLTLDVDEILERMEESACDELATDDTIFSVRGAEGEAQAALNDALDAWCREWVQCEHWVLADTEDVDLSRTGARGDCG